MHLMINFSQHLMINVRNHFTPFLTFGMCKYRIGSVSVIQAFKELRIERILNLCFIMIELRLPVSLLKGLPVF